MLARDTSPEAHAAQLRAYARLGPARRVALAFELSEAAREIAIEGVRARSPGLSRSRAREIGLRRILGGELFDAAWPRSRPADP
jgi:hypothetical protein